MLNNFFNQRTYLQKFDKKIIISHVMKTKYFTQRSTMLRNNKFNALQILSTSIFILASQVQMINQNFKVQNMLIQQTIVSFIHTQKNPHVSGTTIYSLFIITSRLPTVTGELLTLKGSSVCYNMMSLRQLIDVNNA